MKITDIQTTNNGGLLTITGKVGDQEVSTTVWEVTLNEMVLDDGKPDTKRQKEHIRIRLLQSLPAEHAKHDLGFTEL